VLIKGCHENIRHSLIVDGLSHHAQFEIQKSAAQNSAG
jgi:hypothetical protein